MGRAESLDVTPYEVVVIASMIEKEAAIDSATGPLISARDLQPAARGHDPGHRRHAALRRPRRPTASSRPRRLRDRQPVQHPARAGAAADADREPVASWSLRGGPRSRRRRRTSTTCSAATTGATASRRLRRRSSTTSMSASAETGGRLDPWGHANPGRDRLAGRAQPVAGDPQRRVRALGLRLGLRPVAGGARRPAAGARRAGGAGVRGRERDDAAQDRGADLADELTDDARRLRAANTLDGAERRDPRAQHRRARVRPVPARRRRVRPRGPSGAGLRRGWRRAGGGAGARAGRGRRAHGRRARPRHGRWRSCELPRRLRRRACEAIGVGEAAGPSADLVVNATPVGRRRGRHAARSRARAAASSWSTCSTARPTPAAGGRPTSGRRGVRGARPARCTRRRSRSSGGPDDRRRSTSWRPQRVRPRPNDA